MKQRISSNGSSGRRGWNSSTIAPILSTYYKKTEVTLLHAQLQDASLTKSITLFALPAGAIVLFIRLKHSVIFTGPAITAYYLMIGIAGGIQDLMTEYDVMGSAVSNTEYAESFSAQSFDFNNPVNLLISARSVGANLNTSTAGTALIEIYYIDKVA